MWVSSFARSLLPICSVSKFHSLILKERARTDRTGISFSLILFDPGSEADKPFTRKIFSLAEDRIRNVDVLGWFDTRRPAVLLPSTSLEGCRELVKDLTDHLKLNRIRVPVTFFSYPAQKYELQKIWEKTPTRT